MEKIKLSILFWCYFFAFFIGMVEFGRAKTYDVTFNDCNKEDKWEKISNKNDNYDVYIRDVSILEWLYLRHLPERAKNMCYICVGGFVVTNFEHVPVSRYPTYIGLIRPANSTYWEWSNGTRVRDFDIYASRLTNLHNLQDNVTYGVIAKRPTENWLAEPFGEGEYLPLEEFNARSIVCQTVRHNDKTIEGHTVCRKWNITEWCLYSNRYGCHRHTFEMTAPDCDQRQNRVFASQCPHAECECQLRPWSQWSDCNVTRCDDGLGVRERTRGFIGDCDYTDRYPTVIRETCTKAIGCEKLKNENNNTVF